MIRRRRALALALGVVGFACLARGLWIPAKAVVAQTLIARAWAQARVGEPRPRPWPWADTWPVARLAAPRLGVERFVLAGASGESLAFGPGHVGASAAPGRPDNVAVAGHRDTHFRFLERLREGDLLLLESRSGTRRFVVHALRVVHESDVGILERTGRPELTLITCFPFDAVVPGGPLRFVVHAGAAPTGPIDVP